VLAHKPRQTRLRVKPTFGVIEDVKSDENGNVYLLDSQQQQVFKFSADGKYLGTVVRRGPGPGEIDQVYEISSVAGGVLEMLKAYPADMIAVAADGDPLPMIHFTAQSPSEETRFGAIYQLTRVRDLYYGLGMFRLRDPSHGISLFYIAAFNPDGSEAHRYGQWYGGTDFSRPIKVDEVGDYHPQGKWDVDGSGRIYQAVARDVYWVDVRAPDGEFVGQIRREWRPVKRTKAEKQAARGRYVFTSNGELPPITYHMADTDPAISTIQIVGDELWLDCPAQRGQSPQPDTEVRDVFDLEGHLLETRVMAFPHDADEDVVYHLGPDRLVVVRNYRSASRVADPNWTAQKGDERLEAGEMRGEGLHEVVFYRAD